MPDHIRALIVILFLSAVVFILVRQPAIGLIRQSDFSRRRNLWLAITCTVFITPNFWVYFLVALALLLFTASRESNPVALFFFLLFAVPTYEIAIPGMGMVNNLFALSHQRLLVLVILMPGFLVLISQKQNFPFGRTLPDKLLVAYIILSVVLILRGTSITDTLRQGFYQFIDIFLPYYVISRSLKNFVVFREALLCFVIAVMILAFLGIFEALRHWVLYDSLHDVLAIPRGFTPYDTRAGLQRASVTVGTIPLGYVIAVGIGFFLYLQKNIQSRIHRRAGFFLLIVGLIASLSRGPWVGAAFLFSIFILTGQRPVQSLIKIGIIGILVAPLIFVIPGAEKFIDLLPYFGSEEQGNISYREQLLENSLIVINRNPFLGSIDYGNTPEMEAMRQGQGIIDIVNTYIGIALGTGYIGVSLFIGFFLSIIWGLIRKLRRITGENNEEHLLGRSLLATLCAILLIIFTASSISIIPVVYWSVAGLCVAYINIKNQLLANQAVPHRFPQ